MTKSETLAINVVYITLKCMILMSDHVFFCRAIQFLANMHIGTLFFPCFCDKLVNSSLMLLFVSNNL